MKHFNHYSEYCGRFKPQNEFEVLNNLQIYVQLFVNEFKISQIIPHRIIAHV